MGVSSDSSGESVVTKQDEVNSLTFICLNHISSYSPTCSSNLVEEVDGVLHLYGIGSLDTLYSPPATWQPVQIGFHCIEYDEILSLLGKLASRYSQLKVTVISLLWQWETMTSTIYRLLSLILATYAILTSWTE